MLPLFSAESSGLCSGLKTVNLLAGSVTTTLAVKTSAATPGTGTGAGVASTTTGALASPTSNAAAERGTGRAVPVLGVYWAHLLAPLVCFCKKRACLYLSNVSMPPFCIFAKD